MLKLKRVAITGSLASGKSLVGQVFAEQGAHVVDADKIVHQLLDPHTALGKKIIKLLGNDIVVSGKIDRTRIAKKVFLNPMMLRSLERLLRPPVYEAIENLYRHLTITLPKPSAFVAEIPLLFETGGEKNFDTVVVVTAPTEACWERYQASTGHERTDFDHRRARMLNEQIKIEKADCVIDNQGSIEDLRTKAKQFFSTILRRR